MSLLPATHSAGDQPQAWDTPEADVLQSTISHHFAVHTRSAFFRAGQQAPLLVSVCVSVCVYVLVSVN